MSSKALLISTLKIFVLIAIIDFSKSHPIEPSNSLLLSSSSEEVYEDIPFLSLKLLPQSSESTYEDSAPLCKSNIKKINPNDLARQQGYVIIDGSKFKQTIEVEECENEGNPCSYTVLYKSACRQRYMGIQLRVATTDMQERSFLNFTIPSVCECAYFSSRNSQALL